MLGFASLDAADEATVTTFTQILRHPGWLHLPVIFTVQRVVHGPVSGLIDVMRSTGGNDAVVEMRVQAQPLAPSTPFDWMTLPPDVLRVLRAGSVIGSEFQVDLVAIVLDEPVGTILEALQRAADTGAALAALQQAANEVQTPDTSNLLDILGDVEHRLTQAERVLGQFTLPGERHEKP